MSKLHILGIAGTFMGGVAALARELGWQVEGSDQAIYPPMSTQLETLGIALAQGYAPSNISPDAIEVVVGNALSRGNAAVEAVLDAGRRYTSGAQWLAEQVLPGRDTLAVAGTHGKTTTTTILSYLLEAAGRAPGFLIGGVAEDFGVSARLGQGREFVWKPTNTTLPFSTSAANSCTTGRWWQSSITWNTTTPTSSRTWRPSSASSTIWCARCPRAVA